MMMMISIEGPENLSEEGLDHAIIDMWLKVISRITNE